MLQLFSIADTADPPGCVSDRCQQCGRCRPETWLRDPLAHPVLDHMSLGELADLPASALRSCYRE